MKEKIYACLNAVAETFYKEAPADYEGFPVIIYYMLHSEPLFQADNQASGIRRYIFDVDIYHTEDTEELSKQVVEQLKTIKAVLRSEEEIDDILEEGVFGTRLEFEVVEI